MSCSLSPPRMRPLGFPTLAGIVLNGGFRPGDLHRSPACVCSIRACQSSLRDLDLDETSRIVALTRGRLSTGTQRKIDAAISIFEDHIAPSSNSSRASTWRAPDVVTPLNVEAMLIDYARRQPRRIVLPEGDEERICERRRRSPRCRVAAITLLGVESQIRAKAASLGLNLGDITIIDPRTSELVEPFAKEYTWLRHTRG